MVRSYKMVDLATPVPPSHSPGTLVTSSSISCFTAPSDCTTRRNFRTVSPSHSETFHWGLTIASLCFRGILGETQGFSKNKEREEGTNPTHKSPFQHASGSHPVRPIVPLPLGQPTDKQGSNGEKERLVIGLQHRRFMEKPAVWHACTTLSQNSSLVYLPICKYA